MRIVNIRVDDQSLARTNPTSIQMPKINSIMKKWNYSKENLLCFFNLKFPIYVLLMHLAYLQGITAVQKLRLQTALNVLF